MSYSKSIALGSVGQISISESAGKANLSLTLSEQAGGNEIAGFAKGSVSVSVELDAKELIDAGMALAEAKFPSAAPEIAALKAIIDAAVQAV